MSIPCIVIIGRPNVGKSTLFNYIVGSRVAIEEETTGVTRDRISAVVTHRERVFEIIDTGGLGPENPDELVDLVETQIELAIRRADVILFLTDCRAGLSHFDKQIARRLRRLNKPIVLAVNKVDSPNYEPEAMEFHSLGLGNPVLVSAVQKRGWPELFQALSPHLPEYTGPLPSPHMKLAIVGRRNVGKSTFVNALTGEESVIANELAGTTRDAVDVRFEMGDKTFVAIDTAGLRKRRKLDGTLDFYGYTRAQRSVRRADVVVMLVDATSDIAETDKRLASYIAGQYKPCIIAVNKWDLAGQIRTGQFTNYLNSRLPVLPYAPISYMSAKSSKNIKQTVDLALKLFKQANQRVPTAKLNRVLEQALRERRPPSKHAAAPRIYYATQTSVAPPTLDLFVNNPEAFGRNYQRYLENRLRESLPYSEVPIRLFFHKHRRKNQMEQE